MDVFGIHIPSLAIAATAASSVYSSVYLAFKAFDSDQSDKNREFVRQWLLGLKVDDQQWARFFKELFAKVFGEKHFSAKCIRRSALLTVGLVGSLQAYNYFTFTRQHIPGVLSLSISDPLLLINTITWIFAAVVADYFTLWKTRALLTSPRWFGNALAATGIVVGDAIATYFIAPPFIIMVQQVVFASYIHNLTFDLSRIDFTLRIDFITLVHSIVHIGHYPLLLAPLFTSAWLWVYLIVAYAMRGVNRVPGLLQLLSKVQDFEAHPVRTIGYVAATVSAVFVAIITLV
jgi:hypothetical protein